METPLVSICSITYNHAPFIRQCLDGFLMQQCNFPVEIIINDDCSTDGTTEIIREYAEKYPDKIFPIFHEENLYSQGVRGMFQKFVFPKARGKYIALCEGDDYWTAPLKLQKQVDFLESHPDYSMCFHKAKVITEDERNMKYLYEGLREREYKANEIISQKMHIPTASIVCKSVVCKTLPEHKDFCVGDVLIHVNSFVHGRVFCLKYVMSIYRLHQNGWSATSAQWTNYEKTMLPHNLAMLETFPNNACKHLKHKASWNYTCWVIEALKGQTPPPSLKITTKTIWYCNFYLIRVIFSILVLRLRKKTSYNCN